MSNQEIFRQMFNQQDPTPDPRESEIQRAYSEMEQSPPPPPNQSFLEKMAQQPSLSPKSTQAFQKLGEEMGQEFLAKSQRVREAEMSGRPFFVLCGEPVFLDDEVKMRPQPSCARP